MEWGKVGYLAISQHKQVSVRAIIVECDEKALTQSNK